MPHENGKYYPTGGDNSKFFTPKKKIPHPLQPVLPGMELSKQEIAYAIEQDFKHPERFQEEPIQEQDQISAFVNCIDYIGQERDELKVQLERTRKELSKIIFESDSWSTVLDAAQADCQKAVKERDQLLHKAKLLQHQNTELKEQLEHTNKMLENAINSEELLRKELKETAEECRKHLDIATKAKEELISQKLLVQLSIEKAEKELSLFHQIKVHWPISVAVGVLVLGIVIGMIQC